MRGRRVIGSLALGSVLILSGCVVRTYPLTRDRVDQSLSTGNRGYLMGSGPMEEKERKTERTVQIIEVELNSPIKFDKSKKAKKQAPVSLETTDMSMEGNRGYISESASLDIAEAPAFEKYTVQKNDTLQKISKKFYGTTKKWNKIYDANRDVLKGPDRIRPGQVLNIPLDSSSRVSGPKGNLK